METFSSARQPAHLIPFPPHGSTQITTSISTMMFSGKEPMPTAERAWQRIGSIGGIQRRRLTHRQHLQCVVDIAAGCFRAITVVMGVGQERQVLRAALPPGNEAICPAPARSLWKPADTY